MEVTVFPQHLQKLHGDGTFTMHYSCSSYVTLNCRDYPTCGRRRAVKHCSIPPQNRGHGTGVHEEKRAKSTPPPPKVGGATALSVY